MFIVIEYSQENVTTSTQGYKRHNYKIISHQRYSELWHTLYVYYCRVQPGECYHLYTGLQETQLQDYLPPEILRTRLEELCLQIKVPK